MKQYRRRFVVSAMLAFFILLILIIIGIVMMSYNQMNKSSESFLDHILADDRFSFQPSPNPIFGYHPEQRNSPGGFYDITADRNGKILKQEMHGIYDPDALNITETLPGILLKNSEYGKIGSYMYKAKPVPDGIRIVLVDNAFQMQALVAMIRSAMIVGAACMIMMFLILQPIAYRAARANMSSQEKERQFITNASHELKTPVAVIQANAEAMEMINGENKWSRNICQQTTRLNHMISQLLLLEKTDEQVMKGKKEQVDLCDVAENTIAEFKDLFAREGISLDTDLPSELPIYGYKAALEQLFHILTDNAVRYAQGGSNVYLGIKDSRKVAITVFENQVDALPQCAPEQLFERFHRGNISRKPGDIGSGIGLSAAEAIVSHHHGKIEASYPDEHTFRITVKLPVDTAKQLVSLPLFHGTRLFKALFPRKHAQGYADIN